MSIVAIDPGTAHTGLVWMDRREILDAKTIAPGGAAVKADQRSLMERARLIAECISDWMLDRPHGLVVIEGFVTFQGSSRGNAYTFQTPYLCGYLHRALMGERIEVQLSSQVFNKRSPRSMYAAREAMAAGEYPMKGSHLLKNEHTRSAACHGLYWYARHKEGE